MSKFISYLIGLCVFIVVASTVISNNPVERKTIDDISTLDSVNTITFRKELNPLMDDFQSKVVDNAYITDNAVIDSFKDYVSGYGTLCDNAEQITLNTEHYIISNDARVDVSIEYCGMSGDKGHIINRKTDSSAEIWYDNKSNDYYVNLSNSDNQCSGWAKLNVNELDDEFYAYVKNQFNSTEGFAKFGDLLKYIDTEDCKATKLNNGYMLTTNVNMDILETLQPIYLQDGIIKNTFVHIYVVDDDILVKLYYVYDGTSVEQEAYYFKFKASKQKGSFDFGKLYDNGDVETCDLESIVKYYQDNIRR